MVEARLRFRVESLGRGPGLHSVLLHVAAALVLRGIIQLASTRNIKRQGTQLWPVIFTVTHAVSGRRHHGSSRLTRRA